MVLWWIANFVGLLVVIPLVIWLANRVISLALEIRRYADDIREHGDLLAGTLEPIPALEETRRAVGQVAGNATAYVRALNQLV